jgi:hypothetical protein
MYKEIYEFKVPSFLMVGIFNDDVSGYSNEDIDILHKVLREFTDLVHKNNGNHWTLSIPEEEQEPYFTWNPDFISLGCDVYDLELYIF